MDARARMEARRKRILLNAEARMNKIMGRPYEMKETSDEVNASGTRNVSNGFLNGAATVYEENEIPSANVNVPSARLNDSIQLGSGLVETQTTVPSFVNYIFFICLGIITRLSYLFGLSWIFNENLLLPYLIFGIPWAILNSVNNLQVSSMLPSFLLFTGLQQVTVFTICKVIAFFRILTQYFSLYLFCFVILHCVMESIVPMAKP